MADGGKVRTKNKSSRASKESRQRKNQSEELFSDEGNNSKTKGILDDFLKDKAPENERKKKVKSLDRLKKNNSQDQLIIKNNLFDPNKDVDKSRKKGHRSKSSERSLDDEITKIKKKNLPDGEHLLKKSRNKSNERSIDKNEENHDKPVAILRKKPRVKKQETKDDKINLKDNQELEIPETPKKVKTKKPKKPKEELINETEIDDKNEVEDINKVKETPKVKKSKKSKTKEPVIDPDEPPAAVVEEPLVDDGRVLSVTVHRTDTLLTDYYVAHPIARVYIVDADTGKLVDKHDPDRAVTSYYEQDKRKISQILPIMTQPYSFKDHNSTLPVWEEMLVFNENFNYFTREKPNVIIFFEIIDFVSMNRTNGESSDSYGDGDGWHRVAWAFLKICSVNCTNNAGSKARLQLYNPPTNDSFPRSLQVVELYKWWKFAKCRKYPSSLYVTVKPITPPSELATGHRSMFATQQELGFSSQQNESSRIIDLARIQSEASLLWSRLPGVACKVPNTLKHTLNAGSGGCLIVKFSTNGRYLACGGFDISAGHSISIFEIPSGQLKVRLVGHFGLIYDLDWSSKGDFLLSSSADSTARVWDTISWQLRGSLPHPSYVYSGRIHPRVQKVIATACYDHVIRVWATPQHRPSSSSSVSAAEVHAELLQEIDVHASRVNSLCFDIDGRHLFSGDSLGVVCSWKVHVTDKPSSKGLLRDWTLANKIIDDVPSVSDKKSSMTSSSCSSPSSGKAIGSLSVHPNGNRLLVHSRDNVIRMYDLRVGMVMQQYFGLLNFRDLVRSCISCCGGFVFAGSEDGQAYVWNSETGDQIASYTELNYSNTVCCADLHSGEDMVAFCAFGDNQNVLVYSYDKELALRDIGVTFTPLYTNVSSKENPHLKKCLDDSTRLNNLKATRIMEQSAKKEKVRQLLGTISGDDNCQSNAISQSLRSIDLNMNDSIMKTSNCYNFDSSLNMTEPCILSPHSTRDILVANQQYRLASNRNATSAGNRFIPVGISGSKLPSKTPNQMSLNKTETGTKFTFQSVSSINIERCDKVVALYDYIPQRSDELSFCRGDRIAILHRDNSAWWMGEKLTGRNRQQGYLPSNYVTPEVETSDTIDTAERKSSEIITIETEDYPDGQVTAVTNKQGELKFISTPDRNKFKETINSKLEDLKLDDLLSPLTNKKKKTNLKSKFKSINESVV